MGPKMGTTNLIKHVTGQHLEEFNLILQEEDEAKTSKRTRNDMESGSRKYNKGHPKQRRFNKALVDALCGNHLPFCVVDDKEFQTMISIADDRLAVPSRTTISTKLLPQYAEEAKESFMQPLLDQCLSGCLSYDIWQSRTTSDVCGMMFTLVRQDFQISDVFLGLVESFSTTGSAVMEDVFKKLESHNLQTKIIGICRDGGANLMKCARELRPIISNPINEEFFFDSPCLAHAISLCCRNAMKSHELIGQALSSINKVITFTRKVFFVHFSALGYYIFAELKGELITQESSDGDWLSCEKTGEGSEHTLRLSTR